MSGRDLGPRPRPADLGDTGPPPEAGHSCRRGGRIALRRDLLALLILVLVGAMSSRAPEDRSAPAGAGSGAPPLVFEARDPRGILAVALSSDGRSVATGGEDGRVIVRDLDRGTQRELPGRPASVVRALAFSPRGPTLAAGCDDSSVLLWDVAAGEEPDLVRGHAGPVRCLAFSPDGATLATGGRDRSIRIWDVASRRAQAILPGHRGPVNVLVFSPDGRSLASGCARGQIRLWDLELAGARERPGPPIGNGPVRSLCFSGDGAILASACINDRIRLWVAATGRERGAFDAPGSTVVMVGFERGGQRLLALTDRAILPVWEIATGRPHAAHRGEAEVFCGASSRDGRSLAAGGLDATLRIWEIAATP